MSKFGNRSYGAGYGRSSSQASNRGGYSSRNQARDGGREKNPFSRVGSLTVSKSTVETQGEEIVDSLKSSKVNMWLTFRLPNGVSEMKIRNGQKIMLQLGEVKGAPEFVVGKASIPND